MAKILKKKGFNDVLPGQKLWRQCITEYQKFTKVPEKENMTEIIHEKSLQDKLEADGDFFSVWITKKET